MSVATMRRPSAMPRADASRAAKLAMAAFAFSGLPGDTSSQTWSSISRASAVRATARCPACAGLKLPPSKPTRTLRRSPHRGTLLFEAAPARTPARPPSASILSMGGRARARAGAASN